MDRPDPCALLVAYEFPPCASEQARRAADLVSALRHCGWRAAVVTVKPFWGAGWETRPLRVAAQARPVISRTPSLDPARLRMVVRDWTWPLMRRVYQGPSGTRQPATPPTPAARPPRFGWLPFALWRGARMARREKVTLVICSAEACRADQCAALWLAAALRIQSLRVPGPAQLPTLPALIQWLRSHLPQ